MDYADSRKLRVFTIAVIGLSVLIPVLVAVLLMTGKTERIAGELDLHMLPKFHAVLNSVTAAILVSAYLAIRRKNIVLHKSLMLTALLCSVLFLMSYVTYHALAESTPYGGGGFGRYAYYFILITHILLAIVIVPLVGFTLLRALTKRFVLHRKLARWTLPVWLYVAITGVIVYLMIRPYYGS
jgi:putative membrane protein